MRHRTSTRRRTTRHHIIGLAAALAIVGAASSLQACSGSGTEQNSDSTVASGGVTADHNTSDVMFAQMMIPHHEQAIELADMALDPTNGASADVIALAQSVKAAQDPEIAQMKALLGAWGEPVEMMDGMDHSSMMEGMLSTDGLAAIDALTGAAFDTAWLEAMIAHHGGAITMAESALDTGSNGEIKALAEAVIAGQQAEIDRMKALLGV